jgi:hypothetical protein
MREHAEEVADGAATSRGQVVEDDTVGFGKVFAIQVRYSRGHECASCG